MGKTLKTTFDRVKSMLESKEKYRDNDQRLVVAFQWEELVRMGKTPSNMSAMEYMTMLMEGHLTASDTITRARRKCNQHHEHTRGESYNSRQKKQEEVKQVLRSIA